MLPITIWMNIPSHYQSDLFRSLVALNELDLQVMFAQNVTQHRKDLGWDTDLNGIPHKFLNHPFSFLNAIRLAHKQSHRFHIVNGIWAESAFMGTLTGLRLSKSAYAIYSEGRNPAKPDHFPRYLLKNTFGRWLIRGASGMLTVSRLATEYYRKYGLREEQVYPFGYFESSFDWASNSYVKTTKDPFEVIFVGQLVHRKGIDLLLEAMRPLFVDYPGLRLTVIGNGRERKNLEQQALSIEGRIIFEGTMPAGKIRQRIARADLLALPSRFDGWGITVNEALSVGVPAIVSDQCGVAELINNGRNGYVFKSEDVDDLRQKLTLLMADVEHLERLRIAAAETGCAISTGSVAPYLVKCIRHMLGTQQARPIPPWMLHTSDRSPSQ